MSKVISKSPLKIALPKYLIQMLFSWVFFHYVSALVKKLKNEKLFTISLKSFNWNLIRIFKAFPYMDAKITVPFFDELEESLFTNIINVNYEEKQIKGYKQFFKYYRKNWLSYKQLLRPADININFTRTNNPCEVFHKNLHLKCELKQPRFSYITACLGEIAKETFIETINYLSSPRKTKEDKIGEHNDWIEIIMGEIQIFMDGCCLANLITLEQRNDIEDLVLDIERIYEYEDD